MPCDEPSGAGGTGGGAGTAGQVFVFNGSSGVTGCDHAASGFTKLLIGDCVENENGMAGAEGIQPSQGGTKCCEESAGGCYADCDSNAFLNIFDFVCFQELFVQLDPQACDCDISSGVANCDILDYLCFQDAFVAGCP